MAGLLQQGMQPSPQGAPRGAPPQAQPGQPAPQRQQPQQQGGDPRVDMDPQKGIQQREQLTSAALELLYGDQLQQVRQILEQNAQEPQLGVGRVVSQLITVLWKRLAEDGKTAPPGVIVQVAMVVAQAVGEMAIRLRILPEEGNADAIEAGFMIALGEFGKATAQQMPPEQRKRFKEIITSMAQAKEATQGGQQPPQGRQQQPPQGRQAAPQGRGRPQPQPNPRGGA